MHADALPTWTPKQELIVNTNNTNTEHASWVESGDDVRYEEADVRAPGAAGPCGEDGGGSLGGGEIELEE